MTLKIGIIGCGSISEFRHAPEYAANSNTEIVWFFDPQAERAQRLASMFGGQVATSYAQVLDDPVVDAISDCSTNEMHHIITTAALRAGKHVLCEKPMAVSLEGAQAMLDAAKAANRTLMIGQNQRLAPAHTKAREIIVSGEMGRVLTFETTFRHKGPEYWSETKGSKTWFFDQAKSVYGVSGDIGIHKLDLIRYLLGEDYAEVSAQGGALHKKLSTGEPIKVYDNLMCLLKMRSGIQGTLAVSWTNYGPEDNSTTLFCERGIIRIYADPVYSLKLIKLNGEETLFKIGAMQTNDEQSNSGVIDAFVASILTGTQPPVTGEDGYAAIRVVLAAIESSEAGRRVVL